MIGDFNLSYYYHFKPQSHGIDIQYPITKDPNLIQTFKLQGDYSFPYYKSGIPESKLWMIKDSFSIDMKRQKQAINYSMVVFGDQTGMTFRGFKGNEIYKEDFEVKRTVLDFEFMGTKLGNLCVVGLFQRDLGLDGEGQTLFYKFSDGELGVVKRTKRIVQLKMAHAGDETGGNASFVALDDEGNLGIYQFNCSEQSDKVHFSYKEIDTNVTSFGGIVKQRYVHSATVDFDFVTYVVNERKLEAVVFNAENMITYNAEIIFGAFNEKPNWFNSTDYIKILSMDVVYHEVAWLLIEAGEHKILGIPLDFYASKPPSNDIVENIRIVFNNTYNYSKPSTFPEMYCKQNINFFSCIGNDQPIKSIQKEKNVTRMNILMVWPRYNSSFPFVNGTTYRLQQLGDNINIRGVLATHREVRNRLTVLEDQKTLNTYNLSGLVTITKKKSTHLTPIDVRTLKFNIRGNYWFDSEVVFTYESFLKDIHLNKMEYSTLRQMMLIGFVCFFLTIIGWVIWVNYSKQKWKKIKKEEEDKNASRFGLLTITETEAATRYKKRNVEYVDSIMEEEEEEDGQDLLAEDLTMKHTDGDKSGVVTRYDRDSATLRKGSFNPEKVEHFGEDAEKRESQHSRSDLNK
jgi:hypothetical protein